MYAKVKLPNGFVKGDCENCPLCSYHSEINDTYDDDGYCNYDGFQDWNECLIKEWTEDNSYDEVDGTKDHPQDDCPMEINNQSNIEKGNLMFNVFDQTNKKYLVFEVRNDKTGYPNFLIYKDNQWIWRSAKYFKPCIEEENYGCE